MKADGDLIAASWQAPTNILAGTSLRTGGGSRKPYLSNNMGMHVGDDPAAVACNREKLASDLGPQFSWQWLNQTHSVDVVRVEQAGAAQDGDAIYTNVPDIVCCIMTADCLPVFITNRSGSEIALAHAGWRGLAGGVIENTVAHFNTPPEELLVYFGPAIGPCHFEVGEDVKAAFTAAMPAAAIDKLFVPWSDGKFLADLYGLAKAKLAALGVIEYAGGDYCTVCAEDRFYSFRRDGDTGRMVNFICIAS